MARHLGIIREFGLNRGRRGERFPGDTDEEVELVKRLALEHGAYAAELNDGFSRGGAGAADVRRGRRRRRRRAVKASTSSIRSTPRSRTRSRRSRSGSTAPTGSSCSRPPEQRSGEFNEAGLDKLPICMAKTHLSLSHDPKLRERTDGFTVGVRDLRAYTGAGWIVALCGDMQTMPGLGKSPAAMNVDIDERGERISGPSQRQLILFRNVVNYHKDLRRGRFAAFSGADRPSPFFAGPLPQGQLRILVPVSKNLI